MNEENQDSGNSTPISPPQVSTPTPQLTKKELPLSKIALILAVIGAALALGLGAMVMSQGSKLEQSNTQIESLSKQIKELKDTNNAAKTNNEDKVEKDGYQAVFLKSGQVYFGKIQAISDKQITLTNIYYLRTNKQISATPQTSAADPNATDTSLVKLGCELHGPKDTMYIERLNVDFWENLKSDSQVSKAIIVYEKANPNGQKCTPGA